MFYIIKNLNHIINYIIILYRKYIELYIEYKEEEYYL